MQSLLCPYSWARVWQAERELATLTVSAAEVCRMTIWKSPLLLNLYVVRVLVLTGAGVSAESGIPTFRGKDGYWRNLDPTKLATPEAFARDPQLVWEWYRERRQRIRNARPNAAHEAIARLAQHTDEFLLVTQNVDDLHARAGMPAEKMVQIHGDIFVTRCSRCDFSYTGRGGSPEPPGACVVQPTNGRLRSRGMRARGLSIAATSERDVNVPALSKMQCAYAARRRLVRRTTAAERTGTS